MTGGIVARAATSSCVLRTVSPPQWDDLLRRFPQRSVFHTSQWLLAVASAMGLKLHLVTAVEHGTCTALWPWLETRKGPFKIIGSPLPGWSTAYLGPLFIPGVNVNATIAAFLNHESLRRHAYFACKTIECDQPLDLSMFGFARVAKFSTFCLDLQQPEETLWANCRRECRNHTRKAEKLGVETRFEHDASCIDDFWTMSIETFAKTGSQPTYTRELVKAIWRHMHPAGLANVLSAFYEGQRVASLMLLNDDRTMYYWGGASRQQYRRLSANNLLQWRAILEAKRRGMKTYDFIATVGSWGKFKESFGPEKIDIATHWERSSSRLVAVLKNHHERRLRRRQQSAKPVFTSRRFGFLSAALIERLQHLIIG